MTKVLFVDDEPMLLRAIERALRARKPRWAATFASSGQDALALLDTETFDVIVSDIGMPGMDGVTLLDKIRTKHPRIARLVLSGEARLEDRMRAVIASHQWLAKPCPMPQLAATIDRLQWARELVEDPELLALACGVSSLPSAPVLYFAVTQALERDASVEEIGLLIETDVAIASKLLQLVNSSFFGLGERISSVRRAAHMLGHVRLRELLLAAEVFHTSPQVGGSAARGLRMATLARSLANEHHDEVFLAGLLHDVATLVLGPARAAAASPELHARIGGALLGTWGLPLEVVTAVAFHHDPELAPDPGESRLGVVALAHALLGRPELVDERARALGLDPDECRRVATSID
jgi:HD-like signal output (HDOD) protein/ActR/RegA family two-component response regulator